MVKSKSIVGIILGLFVMGSSSISASALEKIDKIYGDDRYETAAKVANQIDKERGKNKSAILVNVDRTMADALSSTSVSGGRGGCPILFTHKDYIPKVTMDALKGRDDITIIGSENSVSDKVMNDLKKKGFFTGRIAGRDRSETSFNIGYGTNFGERMIFVNGYKGEADAMSVAPVAVRDDSPIFLTDKDGGFGILEDTGIPGVDYYAIGTEDMVGDFGYGQHRKRLGGEDRYETNRLVINEFYKNPKEFYIVEGNKLVDGLSGAPLAYDKPIVLVNEYSDKSMLKGAKKITALGDVSPKVMNQCLKAANQK